MTETAEDTPQPLTWYKALDVDELPEGRVKTVTIERKSYCITHVDGQFGALQ